MKNNKGITLIALVITIIVMLILVTVTISVATNGALFNHAANAAKGTKQAIEGENAILNDELDSSIEDIVAAQTNITYTAYEIEDEIIIAGQTFYVIEGSDEHTDTVKLLAALNVETDSNSANINKQNASASPVAFDNTEPYTNDYSSNSCTIRELVNTYVASLGVTVQERRLMLKNEAEGLMSEHRDMLRATNFWLGSHDENNPQNAWEIDGGRFGSTDVSSAVNCGLRPVIVISKDNIPAQ